MLLKLGTISPKVAEWQKVIGLPQTGIFNTETDTATRAWQKQRGTDPDGMVGPKTWAAAGVSVKGWYPPRPNFKSPTDFERTQIFGKFSYRAKNSSEIVITDGWAAKNIVKVHVPQLAGVNGAPDSGVVLFHRRGAAQLQAFFAEVEAAGHIDLVISWAGSFYPRFIRGSQSRLSNHSWGTAFDINAAQNWLGQQPAAVGREGSLLQLVPIANKHGFYWGGHYSSRLDGMHFELARIQQQSADILELFTNETASTAEDPAGSQEEPLSFPTNEDPLASTVESPGAETGMSPEGEPSPQSVEITQSETTNEDGSKTVDTTLNAPAEQTSGILDHVSSLGDRFQGLQGTLDKFGIANPLANTSVGTYLMTFGKFILGAVLSVLAAAWNHPEYFIPALILIGVAALLWNQSRKRVDSQRAGVPVELLQQIVEKK